MFLLNLIVLSGKLMSNNVLKSPQKCSRLVLTSLELNTLFQDRLRSRLRKFSVLVMLMSRSVLELCQWGRTQRSTGI